MARSSVTEKVPESQSHDTIRITETATRVRAAENHSVTRSAVCELEEFYPDVLCVSVRASGYPDRR